MATFARKDVEIRAIADLIASDPTFSSRILQFANSARFTFNSHINNVHHAAALLGLDEIRNATTTLAMASFYRSSASELVRCWQHTIACGLLSDEIARATGRFREQAYTAGVLHDIGRLGLLAAYPAEYQQTIREAAEHALDLLDYEREKFGVDHCEAGRWLAERWALPDEFRVIAGRHHDLPDGSPFDLRTLVHIACRFADHLGYDVTIPLQPIGLEELFSPLPESASRRLIQEMDRIRAAVELHLKEYGACLPETPPPQVDDPEQLIVQAGLPQEFPVCLPTMPDTEPGPDSFRWIPTLLALAAVAGGAWMWLVYVK
jgi:HD-like signal output (HDOD) protein